MAFPPGWRGRLIEWVLGRAIVRSIDDSLARLVAAAERRACHRP